MHFPTRAGTTGPNTAASTDEPAAGRDVAEGFGIGGWRFTPEVVDVFPDHVRASVPFYDAIQDLVAETADWLIPENGLIADLGASTGTTVQRIISRHPQRNIRAILYDTEQTMLDKAAANLADAPAKQIEYIPARIQDPPLKHTDADLTLCLFTLQFLPLRERIAALRLARTSANETGALLVAEKIRPIDPRWAEIGNDLSHDWKAAHGISADAIRAKARALRGVLNPYPQTSLMQAITGAGWHKPEVLFRWHSWIVVGAYATETGF